MLPVLSVHVAAWQAYPHGRQAGSPHCFHWPSGGGRGKHPAAGLEAHQLLFQALPFTGSIALLGLRLCGRATPSACSTGRIASQDPFSPRNTSDSEATSCSCFNKRQKRPIVLSRLLVFRVRCGWAVKHRKFAGLCGKSQDRLVIVRFQLPGIPSLKDKERKELAFQTRIVTTITSQNTYNNILELERNL
ncbi:hypothetical protein GALMADRAFT_209167 [Galerina marginata CBS 339.88]|uniref:Uncharacterized protein n=1 Tax=Galerina marginata (strain CBS 339.88) TaxID=685588 RepID=A0A067TFU1_GALM3|nr:hypothetical protein GALMADRAFT_209167 [Galerina marginata CBS 339.88]